MIRRWIFLAVLLAPGALGRGGGGVVPNALHDSRAAVGDALPCCDVCDESLLGDACPLSMGRQPRKVVRWSRWHKRNASGTVKIPCGVRVDLDEDVDVGGLWVRGHLNVVSGVRVRAGFLYVCGVLSVGTKDHAFEEDVTFTLTKGQRLEAEGVDYGQSTFATFGGLVYLRGAACAQQRPKRPKRRRLCTVHDLEHDFKTWTRLKKPAFPGETTLTFDDDVVVDQDQDEDGEASDSLLLKLPPHWRPGAKVVVASTDWDDAQNEEVEIRRVISGRHVEVVEPLKFAHSAGKGVAAEVATLSRNVKITSECDANNERPRCGNFVISHTPHGLVCGVEFTRLGAQTTLGRYPLHAHMCGTAPQLILRANSVHHNYNRAVVIHSTSNATIAHNVAYETQGHVFVLENGLEVNNLIYENFGAGAVAPNPPWRCPADLRCAGADGCGFGSVPGVDLELCGSRDDVHAEIFWIANPQNDFVRNVAVGGQRSAFSFYPIVAGPLVANPEQQKRAGLPNFVIDMLQRTEETRDDLRTDVNRAVFYQDSKARHLLFSPAGTFLGNVAHSSRIGFHLYPQWTPRLFGSGAQGQGQGQGRRGEDEDEEDPAAAAASLTGGGSPQQQRRSSSSSSLSSYLRDEQKARWTNLTAYKITGSAVRVKTRCASWSCLTIEGMTVVASNMIARSRDVFSRVAFARPTRIDTHDFSDLAFAAGACLSAAKDLVPAGGSRQCAERANHRYAYLSGWEEQSDAGSRGLIARRGFVHCTSVCEDVGFNVSWPPREPGASQLKKLNDGRFYQSKKDEVESRAVHLQRPCDLPFFAFNYDGDTVAKNLAEKCALDAKSKQAGDLRSCYKGHPERNATLATSIRVDRATLAMLQAQGYEGQYYDGMPILPSSKKKGTSAQKTVSNVVKTKLRHRQKEACFSPRAVLGSFHVADVDLDDSPLF